ncbi:MAG TPA: acetylornithine/succinylornithine family transaminase [Roseiflexaceae bacterium]|nr:acetylornithine/succinylornithine family transaminase [Roseiflexaceae bacterium]
MATGATAIDNEQQYILQTYVRPGFVIERGEGCYLYDTEGRRYLDCVAGIAVNALGYGDPDVTAAIQAAAGGVLHLSNLYHSRPAGDLARMLVESCAGVDRVFFCNSGAEAIEGAIKFSRRYAREHYGEGKHTIVSFTGSFHGRTMGAVSITAREKYRQPFEPVMPGVRFVEYNDVAGAAAAISDDVCAVVVEPVQGEGGLSVATPEFIRTLRERCDATGALLVFDEIQCGMSRTGTLWAHEAYDVEPDIMTIAKPLGGGLPIGAIMVRQKVADAIHAGDHGSTFAGGPFITSVAGVVFRKLSAPAFIAQVRAISDYLDESLAELAERDEVIELRGRGLMRGIQVRGSANAVREAGHDHGLLVATAGDDVVRLVPPLILDVGHVDEAIDKLARSLDVLK